MYYYKDFILVKVPTFGKYMLLTFGKYMLLVPLRYMNCNFHSWHSNFNRNLINK